MQPLWTAQQGMLTIEMICRMCEVLCKLGQFRPTEIGSPAIFLHSKSNISQYQLFEYPRVVQGSKKSRPLLGSVHTMGPDTLGSVRSNLANSDYSPLLTWAC